MRNPKAGRAWESFGPDPYLNGEGAYETIIGVQSVGVQACAKHLSANTQEHWRYGASSNMDDRTHHEIYFYPFLRSIEADVASVMCAYNRFNSTSSCHNAGLIGPNGTLRKAGFKGWSSLCLLASF
jgi:beta-glucosidase